METLFRFISPPTTCGYLPDQQWQMEYEVVGRLTPAEYLQRMQNGWRRFGFALFHPVCERCQACRSLRIPIERFRPNRSQRRCWQLNQEVVRCVIGTPEVTREKLDLYDRYHAFQTELKQWPEHEPKTAADYAQSFIDNPFPTQEWCYYLDDRLIGVGYVDQLPGGMSAIYFFYDPDERDRSLGIYNVLNIIEECQRQAVPYLFLGYYVEACRSLAYKATFTPNQIRDFVTGTWADYRL